MEVAHVPGMPNGRFRSCVRKRIPPDLRNDRGLQVTRQPENGTGVRLPGWLQKYGAGLKRLLARCRSLGNMVLSGCPWVGFQTHPGSSCSSPFASSHRALALDSFSQQRLAAELTDWVSCNKFKFHQVTTLKASRPIRQLGPSIESQMAAC
jgi:hypothetical protein